MALNDQLPSKAYVVVPSDTTEIAFNSLHVGGAGIVTIEPEGLPGIYVPFTVPAGGYVLCRGRKVRFTGTTATLIVALTS